MSLYSSCVPSEKSVSAVSGMLELVVNMLRNYCFLFVILKGSFLRWLLLTDSFLK